MGLEPHANLPEVLEQLLNGLPESAEFVRPPFLTDLLVSVVTREPAVLRGPRGTGKTYAVQYLAARLLQRPLRLVQGHADLGIEDLRGCQGLKDGNTVFHPGPALLAAVRGEVLLVDEFNYARPGVIAWLNNPLERAGRLSVPEKNGRSYRVHPNFLAFFCANEGYAGTREPNEAFLDRCRVIACDYWPAAQEVKLLRLQCPHLPELDARRMVEVANAVRQARREGSVDFDFSVRTLRQWALDAWLRRRGLLDSFKEVVLPKVGDPLQHAPQHQALVKLAELALSRKAF